MLCLLILILYSFCVTKVFYSESDGISISITGATNKLENISLLPILSASSRNGLKVNFRRKSLFCLLLLLCGDIESCPGPETSYTNISNFLTRKGFTVLHQNIRGLHGKKFIISDILFNNTKIDIFFLSETFISPDDVFDPAIRGFDFESKSRSNGDASGGGVGAYIKNGIPYTRRVDLETDDLEIIWHEINFKNCKSFVVGVLYRPPDSSKYSNKNFLKTLSDVLNKLSYEDKETILMGDINCDYFKDNDHREIKNLFVSYGYK